MERIDKKIRKSTKKSKEIVTLEAPSYRGSDMENYFEDIIEVSALQNVDYIHLCDNPVGKVHIDPVSLGIQMINEVDIPPIVHLTCRNSTLSSIQKRLLGADALGIKNLLVVSGDGGIGDYSYEFTPSYMNSLEIIDGIKNYLNEGELIPDKSLRSPNLQNDIKTRDLSNSTDFTVGGVVIPERENEVEYVKRKIENGVDFLQTQIIYDKYDIYHFLERLDRQVTKTPPILISLRPVSSLDELRYINDNLPQTDVPEYLLKKMRDSDDAKKFSINMVLDLIDFVKRSAKENSLDLDLGLHLIPGKDRSIYKELIEKVK